MTNTIAYKNIAEETCNIEDNNMIVVKTIRGCGDFTINVFPDRYFPDTIGSM